jgi:hypothetical protein
MPIEVTAGVEPGWLDQALPGRIWARDRDVFGPGEDDPAERLGWLELPWSMRGRLEELRAFATEVAGEAEVVALLGMGGSSLAAEVFSTSLARRPGHPRLVVMDSTHPARVLDDTRRLDPARALFVVSSKSGTTAETLALYRHFAEVTRDPNRFVAITDPGTPLEQLARVAGFRAVFTNPPDIGGRFSALSLFGLVPAALAGADLAPLLEDAAGLAERTRAAAGNPALLLGAFMAAQTRAGRDKLTVILPAALAPFGDWLEQLLAESTGKRGTGVVPICGEPPLPPETYGSDRAFVALGGEPAAELEKLGRPLATVSADGLGAQMFLWEFATAVAGSLLGINPFDQPNVEAAKRLARRALEGEGTPRWPEDDPAELFEGCAPPELAVIGAFADPSPPHRAVLAAARARLATSGVATMAGFGPRYLHSTGQLHKGGPAHLRALIVLEPPGEDLPIPGERHSFGELIAAQAHGDADALRAAGRRVACTTWQRFEDWVGS